MSTCQRYCRDAAFWTMTTWCRHSEPSDDSRDSIFSIRGLAEAAPCLQDLLPCFAERLLFVTHANGRGLYVTNLLPVLDLPAGHCLIVKLKALEVNDQGVWQALDAAALHSIHLRHSSTQSRMQCTIQCTCNRNIMHAVVPAFQEQVLDM